MDEISLVQLRAIIGDDEFNKRMTPRNIDRFISKGIDFQDFIAVDNKLANSYEVQNQYYSTSDYNRFSNIIQNTGGVIKIHHDLQSDINKSRRDNFMKEYDWILTKNDDGTYDVDGDVDISSIVISELPVKFRNVNGYFDCGNNHLSSLEGCPIKVGSFFNCAMNLLTSLKGAPRNVGGKFGCSNNKLTTLEGAPEKVTRSFNCSYNKLTTLRGAPETVEGTFDCSNNQLTSLEGSPVSVADDFYCYENKLVSLNGAPEKIFGEFNCEDNPNLSDEEITRYHNKLRYNQESYSRFSDFYFS